MYDGDRVLGSATITAARFSSRAVKTAGRK
jgi:hypothetical protein